MKLELVVDFEAVQNSRSPSKCLITDFTRKRDKLAVSQSKVEQERSAMRIDKILVQQNVDSSKNRLNLNRVSLPKYFLHCKYEVERRLSPS